jgi:hypothetical protein
MTDATDRISEHARRFNDAVRTGGWADFVGGFAPDAVMTFSGMPVGPFRGRDDILRAYLDAPPSQTLTVTWIEGDEHRADATVAWSDGGTGTMSLVWRDGLVSALTVAFD